MLLYKRKWSSILNERIKKTLVTVVTFTEVPKDF